MKDLSIPKITKSYRLLGLSVCATLEEVNAAYKKLRQQVHPDKYANEPFSVQNTMTYKFVSIKKAFELISENYDDIQKVIEVVDQFSIISLKSRSVRSHITYSQISKL